MHNPITFIDAHHHLWIPEQAEPDLGYGWLRDIGAMKPFGDPTPIQRNYEWAEYANESRQHVLTGSVHVQADGTLPDPVAETAWVQSVFDQSSLMHAIVALVDLSKASAQDVLFGHKQYACFRGVRQIIARLDDNPALCFAPRHFLHDAAWREHYALLQEHELSFDLQLYPEQMHDAAEFLSQYPGVPVIIDHAGSPYDQSRAGLTAWTAGLKELASLDHVAIKLSGFGMFDKQRSSDSIRPLVDVILDLFGTQRILFASNFPVDKLMGTFDSTLSMIDQCLAGCSRAERQDVWAGNAQRIYRLQQPSANA